MLTMKKQNYTNSTLNTQEASALIHFYDDKKRILSRKEVVKYMRTYGLGEERLKVFEASGRDFDKKPITEQQAVVMARLDFDNYDMERVALFGENGLSLLRKYFICAQILAGYSEAQLHTVINNIAKLEKYEKAKAQFMKTYEEAGKLCREARTVSKKAKEL